MKAYNEYEQLKKSKHKIVRREKLKNVTIKFEGQITNIDIIKNIEDCGCNVSLATAEDKMMNYIHKIFEDNMKKKSLMWIDMRYEEEKNDKPEREHKRGDTNILR